MVTVICDDDAVWRRAMSRAVRGKHHHAENLREALRITKETQPNVLLLDVLLPDGLGWEAIPQFRAASPNTEIVVVTSFGRMSDGLRVLGEHRAFAYLDKSEGLKAIRSVVRRAFIASCVKSARAALLGPGAVAPPSLLQGQVLFPPAKQTA